MLNNKRTLLIGGGDYFKCFISLLNDVNFNSKIFLIYNSLLDKEWSHLNKEDLRTLCHKKKINIIHQKSNLRKTLNLIIKKNKIDIILVFGSREIFPRSLLEIKNVLWLNFHPTPLPKFRGVANDSWAFMQRQEKKIGATLHRISSKIDQGEIYLSSSVKTNLNFSSILERRKFFLKFLQKDFFPKCIKWLNNPNHTKGIPQNDLKSFYGPSLRAEKNAIIDFSWEVFDIISFIKAFSNPYKGASFRYTECNNKLYFSRSAKIIKKEYFHPYSWGLIQKADKNSVIICANGGLLELDDITPMSKFRIGSRIYNTLRDIEKSKLIRV